MLVKCSPIVILSYRFIEKKMKDDNSNPLKIKNHDWTWSTNVFIVETLFLYKGGFDPVFDPSNNLL